MNIRTVSIEQLKPAPYNPRLKLEPGSRGYERLKRSLDEFDLVQPIVWNEKTGHVVGGHQRLEILKDQGRTSLEVVVVSLDLSREKALNVALNNSQVAGDWDPDKLMTLIEELHELPEIDATLTGFDAGDIRDLLLTPADDPTVGELPTLKDETVQVTFEIDAQRWESLRPEIDRLLATHKLKAHIKLPQEG